MVEPNLNQPQQPNSTSTPKRSAWRTCLIIFLIAVGVLMLGIGLCFFMVMKGGS